MGELRERFRWEMVLRGFTPGTIFQYERVMTELAKAYMRAPDKLSNEEIHKHLQFFLEERGLQWSTVNIHFSAYRLFYGTVLGWNETRFSIPRRGRSGKLCTISCGKSALHCVDIIPRTESSSCTSYSRPP